jgi:hypothetical protein
MGNERAREHQACKQIFHLTYQSRINLQSSERAWTKILAIIYMIEGSTFSTWQAHGDFKLATVTLEEHYILPAENCNKSWSKSITCGSHVPDLIRYDKLGPPSGLCPWLCPPKWIMGDFLQEWLRSAKHCVCGALWPRLCTALYS